MIKTVKLLFLFLLSIAGSQCFGQKDLSDFKNLKGIYISSHWGDINVKGNQADQSPIFNIEATYTDTSEHSINIDNLSDFLSFEQREKILFIETREPKGFESIDLKLVIPDHLFTEIMLTRGGNIFASNLKNGIEINSLNGSVKLEGIHEYALVSATNGEIEVEFEEINRKKAISLVTLNGGVTAILPQNSKHDLRIISRKNGYVESDFYIKTDKPIVNLNVKKYASQPILNTGQINGGGSLLFLSTENGPIAIKKSKS